MIKQVPILDPPFKQSSFRCLIIVNGGSND
jgi:hypothetical protein